MIFIYLGGGRSQLWLTLLGLLVTVVFNSGLLSSPASFPVGPSTVSQSMRAFRLHNPVGSCSVQHLASQFVRQVEWPVTADPWQPRAATSAWITLLVPGLGLLAFIACKSYFSVRRQVSMHCMPTVCLCKCVYEHSCCHNAHCHTPCCCD